MKCSAPDCQSKVFADAKAFGGLGVCRKHWHIFLAVKDDPDFWAAVQRDLQEQSKAAFAAHGFAAFRCHPQCSCSTKR